MLDLYFSIDAIVIYCHCHFAFNQGQEQSTTQKKKKKNVRFQKSTESDRVKLLQGLQTKSTQRNTTYAVRLFKG